MFNLIDRIVGTVTETLNTIFGAEERTIKQLVSGVDGIGANKVRDQLKTVKYAPGYQLTFSLFSGDASNGVREWKVQEAINGKEHVGVISRMSLMELRLGDFAT
jgi:phosphatidylinositol glycan class S